MADHLRIVEPLQGAGVGAMMRKPFSRVRIWLNHVSVSRKAPGRNGSARSPRLHPMERQAVPAVRTRPKAWLLPKEKSLSACAGGTSA